MLAVLVWRLGTGPFLDGLDAVDAGSLAAAFALAVLTTLCCAWRWRIVAGGLGVDLPLGGAVAAYYRSLFLNVTLPGGVVGDVHRGRQAAHGLRGLRSCGSGRPGRRSRSVLTVAVLLALPSPLHDAMPLVAPAVLAAAVAVALAVRRHRAVRAWPAIALASALVVTGHAATFLVAAHAAAVDASRDDAPAARADRPARRRAARTSAAGARARASRRGRSPPPGSARRPGSPPRSPTA